MSYSAVEEFLAKPSWSTLKEAAESIGFKVEPNRTLKSAYKLIVLELEKAGVLGVSERDGLAYWYLAGRELPVERFFILYSLHNDTFHTLLHHLGITSYYTAETYYTRQSVKVYLTPLRREVKGLVLGFYDDEPAVTYVQSEVRDATRTTLLYTRVLERGVAHLMNTYISTLKKLATDIESKVYSWAGAFNVKRLNIVVSTNPRGKTRVKVKATVSGRVEDLGRVVISVKALNSSSKFVVWVEPFDKQLRYALGILSSDTFMSGAGATSSGLLIRKAMYGVKKYFAKPGEMVPLIGVDELVSEVSNPCGLIPEKMLSGQFTSSPKPGLSVREVNKLLSVAKSTAVPEDIVVEMLSKPLEVRWALVALAFLTGRIGREDFELLLDYPEIYVAPMIQRGSLRIEGDEILHNGRVVGTLNRENIRLLGLALSLVSHRVDNEVAGSITTRVKTT